MDEQGASGETPRAEHISEQETSHVMIRAEMRALKLVVGGAIALVIAAFIWQANSPKARCTWDLSSDRKLTIWQYTDADNTTELKLTGKNLDLNIASIALPNGEHVEAANVAPLEVNDELLGILMRPRVISLKSKQDQDTHLSLPKAVLPQILAGVINVRTGVIWNGKGSSETSKGSDLRSQFFDSVESDESTWPKAFAGIGYVHLDGKSATADFLASLDKFPDLKELSIEEGTLKADAIVSIGKLPRLQKVWLDYIDFDEESLRALASLSNVDFIRLHESDVKKVSGGDAILEELRNTLPKARILVVNESSD